MLKEIDPEGSALRGRHWWKMRVYVNQGHDYAWHLDGNLDSKLYMVGQMFFMKFQVEAEVKKVWSLLYRMKCFDQAATSATDEEYPGDYQEYFSYLMDVLERRQPETWQLKRMVNFQD